MSHLIPNPSLPSNSSQPDTAFFWGRRYHSHERGAYLYPNDEEERDRLDFQHDILKNHVTGKLFHAPISKSPAKIIDIGTGTGIWVIEMAQAHPNTHIIGLDLSTTEPRNCPGNANFLRFDCSKLEWDRHWIGTFDLIHSRMMGSSFDNFLQFIYTSKVYLNPGTGWLECQELHLTPCTDDNTIPSNWGFKDWVNRYRDAVLSCRPTQAIMSPDKIKRWMERAGYVDVHEKIYKIPIGVWPLATHFKNTGALWRRNLLDSLQALSYKTFGPNGLNWTRERVDEYLRDVYQSLYPRRIHAYHKYYVVYGRRASAPEEENMRLARFEPSHTTVNDAEAEEFFAEARRRRTSRIDINPETQSHPDFAGGARGSNQMSNILNDLEDVVATHGVRR